MVYAMLYCSTDCKIAHRPEHEKNCWKRIVEINDERTIQKYGRADEMDTIE